MENGRILIHSVFKDVDWQIWMNIAPFLELSKVTLLLLYVTVVSIISTILAPIKVALD